MKDRIQAVIAGILLCVFLLTATASDAWLLFLRSGLTATLQNFTTWNPGETDPGTNITVAATKITYTALTRNRTSYHALDRGAGYYSGNFEFDVTVFINSATSDGGVSCAWMVANALNDLKTIQDASDECLVIRPQRTGASHFIRVIETHNGTLYFDGFTATTNTYYYLRINRDESVGTYGTIYAYIYSNSQRTVLLDTLSLALHEKTDYRYVYGVNTFNDGNPAFSHGFVMDMIFRE